MGRELEREMTDVTTTIGYLLVVALAFWAGWLVVTLVAVPWAKERNDSVEDRKPREEIGQ